MKATKTIATTSGKLIAQNARNATGASDDVNLTAIVRAETPLTGGPGVVYLGGTASGSAAAAGGFPLSSVDPPLYIPLEAGESLYATGEVGVYVLLAGR